MDWATFFKDNPVIVGALIATIPILISNIVQIYVHISEVREKRKEAKRQVREKWLERDLLMVMGMIENLNRPDLEAYTLDSRVTRLEEKAKSDPSDNTDEFDAERKSIRERAESIYAERQQTLERISVLTFSFMDTEILNRSTDFFNASLAALESENKSFSSRDWILAEQKAGHFHKALRDKLISIRDS